MIRNISKAARNSGRFIALTIASLFLTPILSFAQDTGAVSWPHTFTLGLGGAANDNVRATGTAGTGEPLALDPDGNFGYTNSVSQWEPEFHMLAEIPLGGDWMFAPRIAYNDYSLKWNSASSLPANAVNQPLSLTLRELGADLLFKFSISDLHVMAGANLSTPLQSISYNQGGTTGDLTNYEKFLAGAKAGVGYDIPMNAGNSIWLTPEVFYTYPITSFASNNGFKIYPMTISGGASLKFGTAGTPPPPQPTPMVVTITAHGVMPDGTLTADLISPEQTTHTRASIPFLPYIFFDEGSSVISTRYNHDGLTGYSIGTALQGKDALEANHEILDVIGVRMKDHPAMVITVTGTNCNTGVERNNIELSKARALAVADYLHNIWGINPNRIIVDQRNLPEIPTNPLTKAGREENRRVEFSSNDVHLSSPIIIESRDTQTIGGTTVRYDITLTPDPVMHAYSNWTITLDKEGVPIAPFLSGSGATPAFAVQEIPNASSFDGQMVHFRILVTDANGESAYADGYTRIMARTINHDRLEKFAMLSFDFDRSDINLRARQMLELIGESISNGATGVRIDGYCDSTGSPEYNQVLSEARANSAATTVRSLTSLPSNLMISGHGLQNPRFRNDLPEGRQLNRRVEFSIEHQLETMRNEQ